MIPWICLILLPAIVQSNDRYLFSNFHIGRSREAKENGRRDFSFLFLSPLELDDPLIVNTTSRTTFLCTKQNGNDEEDFEITTNPAIPYEQIRIYENRLNNTAMELTIHSINYVGMFTLVCSSLDHQSIGKQLDVIVGSKFISVVVVFPSFKRFFRQTALPDAMTHVENCTVYENRYINCTIHAPILARAIHNHYPCHFDMMETHSSVYKQPAESIHADIVNQTITFQWLPVQEGVFPDDIDILIIGEMRFYGKTNVTINLTPRRESTLLFLFNCFIH